MKNGYRRILSTLVALSLMLLLPIAAMAETVDQGPTLSLGCGFGVDEGAMNAEQKATREAAVNQYYAVEDEVLAGLVEAGTAAQADVDTYRLGRDARWQLTLLDKSGWTDEQSKAYESAAALSGAERDAAVDELVSAGQLTTEQGEALKVSNTNPSRSINLTDSAAAETATSSLDALRQTLKQTLTDAGISISTNESRGDRNKDAQGDMQKGSA